MQQDVDVVVIGAGLAGLAAAESLVRSGLRVRVLEARDRVGGRVHDAVAPGGATVELGAQWIGTGHTHVLGLAARLGLPTAVGHHHEGAALNQLTGETFRGRRPFGGERAEALDAALRLLAEHAAAAAHDDGAARRLRDQTVAGWTARHVPDPAVRAFLDQAVGNEECADPGEVSAALLPLVLDGYLDGDGPLPDVEAFRLVDGPQRLAVGLASALPDGALQLRTPVHGVLARDRGVAVVAGEPTAPEVVRASAVVLAVPLPHLLRLHLDPPLPGHLDQALQRLPMGSVVKAAIVWERPAWREHGRSGLVVGDGRPWCTFVDSSPAGSARGEGVGVLTGFAVGAAARRLSALGQRERRRSLEEAVRRLLGARVLADLGAPLGHLEHDWVADPWARGGYGPLSPPGVDPLARTTLFDGLPGELVLEGRAVVASADLDPDWPAYMEGALRQGAAAAERLHAALP